MFAAGSVFVKSGLLSVRKHFCLQEVNAAVSFKYEVEVYKEKLTPTCDLPELPC
jgi:hypothetical protein